MIRFFCAAFIAFGAFAAAPASAQEFTPEQQRAIDAQVRDYLLRNPEVIVEAMQALEARREREERLADQAMLSRLETEIENDGYSFVAGNPNGDITVVEFSDYRCGYCKQAHEGMKALLNDDANVRVVIKEFPILGPESTYAARVAMAAQRQGGDKYLALNDALMTWRGDLSEGAVMSLADEVGLDMDQLRADLDDPAIAENIQRTYALARELRINGTPGFIIGGQIVRGFVPYDQLRELVREARQRG